MEIGFHRKLDWKYPLVHGGEEFEYKVGKLVNVTMEMLRQQNN